MLESIQSDQIVDLFIYMYNIFIFYFIGVIKLNLFHKLSITKVIVLINKLKKQWKQWSLFLVVIFFTLL